ncbi:MAG: histidine phosphatase family protein [Myxococcales bacterium]|nr:histidine phosphatase family protein [Myxococcales bacterium]
MPSKTLILMRHGDAEEASSDHGRPLSARGRRQCLDVGTQLRAASIAVDHVLCSSAVRAVQSAQLVLQALGSARAIEPDATLYLASPQRYVQALREAPAEPATILLVAHNPGLSQLASAIADRHVGLSTAGYDISHHAIERWAELFR